MFAYGSPISKIIGKKNYDQREARSLDLLRTSLKTMLSRRDNPGNFCEYALLMINCTG